MSKDFQSIFFISGIIFLLILIVVGFNFEKLTNQEVRKSENIIQSIAKKDDTTDKKQEEKDMQPPKTEVETPKQATLPTLEFGETATQIKAKKAQEALEYIREQTLKNKGK